MHEVIRSPSNARLKRARAVGASRERGFVLLEGQRLVKDAIRAGWFLEEVFLSGTSEALARELEGLLAGTTGQTAALLCVEPELLARVSPMKGTPSVLAIAREPKAQPLSTFSSDPRGLLLVAAGVQDPGNLGAIARAAEAGGAAGLVVTGAGASPFGSKALRGSMGSLLRLPIALLPDAKECAQALNDQGWRQALTRVEGGVPYARFDWKGPLALWFAAESGALPKEVELAAAAFEGVSIPMAGQVESLNVATAAAILCFAAGRVEGAGPPAKTKP